MPKIHITTIAGDQSELDAPSGQTLMEALTDNNYDEIEAICGGVCNCSTCHVYVDDNWFSKLPEASEDEKNLLRASEHCKDNSRLSCQVTLTDEMDGLTLKIAEQSY